MLVCTFGLVGVSPISFSAPVQSQRQVGESSDTFEARTWRERLHVNVDGNVFIPPMAIKNCLSEVAKYLSETVPGKGKSTYTKHFEAGILCVDPVDLNIKAKDVQGERLFVPSDGRRGSGKRVWKTFPTIPEWRGKGTVYVLDPALIDKPEKIEEYLGHAGKFIGLLRFRPRNNGFYGRFIVENFVTHKADKAVG